MAAIRIRGAGNAGKEVPRGLQHLSEHRLRLDTQGRYIRLSYPAVGVRRSTRAAGRVMQ